MYGAIESSRIIKAFLENVPGTFVRDYRANNGYLAICRGQRTFYDFSADTDKFTTALPAETLCNVPMGWMQAASLAAGLKLMRPGWKLEMKKARRMISDRQADRIEKALGLRVFHPCQ